MQAISVFHETTISPLCKTENMGNITQSTKKERPAWQKPSRNPDAACLGPLLPAPRSPRHISELPETTETLTNRTETAFVVAILAVNGGLQI
jgi:hypothetical protein